MNWTNWSSPEVNGRKGGEKSQDASVDFEMHNNRDQRCVMTSMDFDLWENVLSGKQKPIPQAVEECCFLYSTTQAEPRLSLGDYSLPLGNWGSLWT